MKRENNTKLRKDYEKVIKRYIVLFCTKQDLEFEYFVSDEIGGTASFGDIYYFDMLDIIRDIDTMQPKGLITEWLEHNLSYNSPPLTYKLFIKGYRHKSKE